MEETSPVQEIAPVLKEQSPYTVISVHRDVLNEATTLVPRTSTWNQWMADVIVKLKGVPV